MKVKIKTNKIKKNQAQTLRGQEDIDVLRTFIFRPNFGANSSCVNFKKTGLVSVNIYQTWTYCEVQPNDIFSMSHVLIS